MNIRKVQKKDYSQLIDLLNNIGWFKEYLSKSLDVVEAKFLKHIELLSRK